MMESDLNCLWMSIYALTVGGVAKRVQMLDYLAFHLVLFTQPPLSMEYTSV